MADASGAWGIDIGQAGLKAVRLEYAEASDQVTAVAFDYIPHPKILSQPDANPEELVQQALETFLSRNNVDGDLVSISVPGQTALARFIQLPPVESSKVPEIVKYEARQQIPFALEDVIWDYQALGSSTEEGGFMLDAEVGLFAMKRDQVQQSLDPFLEQKVEVETIQIAPLAIYNFLCFDQLEIRKGDSVDPDADYTIVLDMGADNTTLLVSNGEKIWLRNVPIGGNHFTRALTKELKLTFAKAEHLKLNATKSPDPRSVFQALRPIFNDYVSEIQRSIGYFSSVNKDAKIAKIIGVGNGFKLAGLQKFLQQNLQYQVDRVHAFDAVAGDAVLRAPLFQDNIMSFAVPYGLALQCLGVARINTSLLPPEIITERLIRKKKPWAVAAAAALLIGLSTSAMGFNHVMGSVSPTIWDNPEGPGGSVEKKADEVKKKAADFKSQYTAAVSDNEKLKTSGDALVGTYEDRIFWPEVYKAINECLPRDVDNLEVDDPSKVERVKVEVINVSRLDDPKEWFDVLQTFEKETMRADDQETPPTGPGYLFTLNCVHHYKENDPRFRSKTWIIDRFLVNFKQWTMQQADSPQPVPIREMGITHPVLVSFATAPPIFLPVEGEDDLLRPLAGRTSTRRGRRSGGSGDEHDDAGSGGLGRGRARRTAPSRARNSRGVGFRASRRGGGGGDDHDDTGGGGRSRRGGQRPRPTTGLRQPVNGGVAGQDGEVKMLEIPQSDFTIQFFWKPTLFKDRPKSDPATKTTSEQAAGETSGEPTSQATDKDAASNQGQPAEKNNEPAGQ